MFPSGGFQLSPAGEAELANTIVPELKGLQNAKIVVYGFTYNVPVGAELQRQGIPDNLVLSTCRAATVATFLVAQGINPNIVSAKGVGDTLPVAPNDTPQGRAQNCRIEITVQGPGAERQRHRCGTQGIHATASSAPAAGASGAASAEMLLPTAGKILVRRRKSGPPIGENVSHPSILGSIGRSSRQRKFWHQICRRQRIGSGIGEGITNLRISHINQFNNRYSRRNHHIGEAVGPCKGLPPAAAKWDSRGPNGARTNLLQDRVLVSVCVGG